VAFFCGKFAAAVVVDTGGKFTIGIKDTGWSMDISGKM
jgi:hypothetical protein